MPQIPIMNPNSARLRFVQSQIVFMVGGDPPFQWPNSLFKRPTLS
jgi:hypothetical protein